MIIGVCFNFKLNSSVFEQDPDDEGGGGGGGGGG